jgi:hypothetical protein
MGEFSKQKYTKRFFLLICLFNAYLFSGNTGINIVAVIIRLCPCDTIDRLLDVSQRDKGANPFELCGYAQG